jgi:hypothetical protein
MKRLVLSLVLVSTLLLAGCGTTNGDSHPTPRPTQVGVTPTITPQPTQPTTEYPNEPPSNVTWISPGKVEIGNFFPGATAEWSVRVHNGNDVDTEFLIKYRYPDHVGDGYSYPSSEVSNWVTISTNSLVFGPHETRDIPVALIMPSGAVSPGHKWEFWISVVDNSQEGFVKTELCIRWLVTME